MARAEAINAAAAVGFDRAAAEYERARPGYPPGVIDVLVQRCGLGPMVRVCDLAAGTGKLTSALVATGADVVAVEPVAGMRAVFEAVLPGVEILIGTAEAMPFDDASLDIVTCAQAAHWFDLPAFLAEAKRVIRPGGWLGLVWNERDETVPWMFDFAELLVEHGGGRPYTPGRDWPAEMAAGGWSAAETHRFDNPQEVPPAAIVERAASTSYIAALPDDRRAVALAAVADLIATHPATAGRSLIDFPHRTELYLARR